MTGTVWGYSVLAAAGLAAAVTGVPASGQSAGDGFHGPIVFGDSELDHVLMALDRQRTRQDLVARDMPDVSSPPARDFSDLVISLRDGPEMELDEDSTIYWRPVAGDASLDAKLGVLTTSMQDRNQPLFLQVVARADGLAPGDLAEIAPIPHTEDSFGMGIWDDRTLDAKMAVVMDKMNDEQKLAAVLPAEVQPFTDATLDAWVATLAHY